MAILPLFLCCTVFLGILFLFPFGKCRPALIAFVILLNDRQKTPCQRLIYKLRNFGSVDLVCLNGVSFIHSFPPFTAYRRVLRRG